MDMEARRAFAASQQEVWDALNDPDVLKACIPGCEQFEAVGTDQYALDLALKIGAGSPRFRGNVQLADRFPPERYESASTAMGAWRAWAKGVRARPPHSAGGLRSRASALPTALQRRRQFGWKHRQTRSAPGGGCGARSGGIFLSSAGRATAPAAIPAPLLPKRAPRRTRHGRR